MGDIADPGRTKLTSYDGDERWAVVDDPDGTPLDRYMEVGDFALRSGTPTAGQIAIWADANAVEDSSAITVSGTKVGINNASPAAQLEVDPFSSSIRGIEINMPVSTTTTAMRALYNTTTSMYLTASEGVSRLNFSSRDLGNDEKGSQIFIGRNTNAGAEGPAAGALGFERASGADRYIWIDVSNKLRWHTAAPTGSSGSPTVADTDGSVIGDQTSNEKFKRLLGAGVSGREALGHIRAAVAGAERFQFVDGAYNGQEFDGIVIRNGEGLQRYGQDADAEHDGGKALNVANAIGDLMKTMVMQADQIISLQARIDKLEGATNGR